MRILSASLLAVASSLAFVGGCSSELGGANEGDAGPNTDKEDSEQQPSPDAADTVNTDPPDEPSVEDGPEVDIRAFFSKPKRGSIVPKGDGSLDHLITGLLKRAQPGSSVRATLYKFSNRDMVAPFAEAHERGVDVKLVLDIIATQEDEYRVVKEELVQKLGTDNVRVCPRPGCVGDKRNHNKFYLFSRLDADNEVGAVENVVVQSSANLSASHHYLFNDSLLIRGDTALYQGYMDYWQDMWSDKRNPDYLSGSKGLTTGDTRTNTTAFFMPSQGSDPMLNILAATSCPDGGTVRVAQSRFKDERARLLMEELVRLRDERGCDVQMVLRKAAEENHHVEALKAAGMRVAYFKERDILGIDVPSISVHSKYVLIDGVLSIGGQAKRRKVVLTGSSNFSDSGLTNDETILGVESEAIHNLYMENWQHMVDFIAN